MSLVIVPCVGLHQSDHKMTGFGRYGVSRRSLVQAGLS